MQYGHLHWSTLKADDDWRKQVLDGFAANSASIERLRWLIQNNDRVLQRIILQHTEQFLQTLIEKLTAEAHDTISNIVDEIAEMIVVAQKERNISATEKKQTQYVLWQQVFRLVALEENKLSAEGVAMKLLRTQFGDDPINDIPFLSKGIIAPILKKLKDIADIDIKKLKEKLEIKPDPGKKDIPTIDEEGIFVQNAGIILLHPFLNAFFKNLGLVAEGSFIDESARGKALYLLHFLATGRANAEEHELVMEKVLCGWSLENPVSNSIELTTSELAEANGLLVEAIQQWDALKNTSPSGLREGFLQRMGKLHTKNSILQLQIESNSIDVLLDYLPWNLSMVQLPWMKDLLKVEWR